MTQTKNLYFIMGMLAIAVVGLGAYVVHQEMKPKGVEMSITSNGVKVQEN
jgi:hypothetical protein